VLCWLNVIYQHHYFYVITVSYCYVVLAYIYYIRGHIVILTSLTLVLSFPVSSVYLHCPTHTVRLRTDDARDHVTLTKQNTALQAYYIGGGDIKVCFRSL